MKILVLPGDGICPEIVEAGVEVLKALNDARNLGLELEYEDIGLVSLKKYGTTLRPELLEKVRDFDGVILGPQSNLDYPPEDEGGVNISAIFRIQLDLYANARPARTRPGVAQGKEGLDRVVMFMAGAENIRDVIVFPKTQSAHCPSTNAPGEVSAEQLKEAGIRLRTPRA